MLNTLVFGIRPIISEDPLTTPKSKFTIESGITHNNSEQVYDMAFLYGLNEKIELSLKSSYTSKNLSFENGFHIKYFTPFFTLKGEYLKETTDSNSSFSLTASKYILEAKNLSLFFSISKSFSFKNSDEDYYFYSLSLSKDYEEIDLYFDWFFEVNKNNFSIFKKHDFTPLIGITYDISEKVIIDFAYSIRMKEFKKEKDLYILGFTFNF